VVINGYTGVSADWEVGQFLGQNLPKRYIFPYGSSAPKNENALTPKNEDLCPPNQSKERCSKNDIYWRVVEQTGTGCAFSCQRNYFAR
jgi:hypothetical protein